MVVELFSRRGPNLLSILTAEPGNLKYLESFLDILPHHPQQRLYTLQYWRFEGGGVWWKMHIHVTGAIEQRTVHGYDCSPFLQIVSTQDVPFTAQEVVSGGTGE